MRSIVYYISSHGYGHAARQQAVIRLLSERGIPVYVRTAAPQKFFAFPGVHYHRAHYDIGVIQPGTLQVDPAATLHWYQRFLQEQEALVTEEAAFLQAQNVGLVVSDMPPVAFEIAARAGLPSVALTHFTWDWVYTHYLDACPAFAPVIERIRASYGRATLALQLPFAHEFDMFPRVEPSPLIINAATRPREQARAEMHVPPAARMALLTMGGHDWAFAGLQGLYERTGWVFLVTPGAWPQVAGHPAFRLIPDDYDGYHNLIAAADIVVGKAGGSTVAECIGHRTPFLYTLNADWRENELLHDALCRFANSRFVEKHEFERGDWAHLLDELVTQPFTWPRIATNGAEAAAARLCELLQS